MRSAAAGIAFSGDSRLTKIGSIKRLQSRCIGIE